MSRYQIELRPAAVRALRRIDPQMRGRLQGAIALLAVDPRPPSSRALKGRPGLRVRVGDYRILYTVHDEVLLIVIVTVGHRRDVYRRSAAVAPANGSTGPASGPDESEPVDDGGRHNRAERT